MGPHSHKRIPGGQSIYCKNKCGQSTFISTSTLTSRDQQTSTISSAAASRIMSQPSNVEKLAVERDGTVRGKKRSPNARGLRLLHSSLIASVSKRNECSGRRPHHKRKRTNPHPNTPQQDTQHTHAEGLAYDILPGQSRHEQKITRFVYHITRTREQHVHTVLLPQRAPPDRS